MVTKTVRRQASESQCIHTNHNVFVNRSLSKSPSLESNHSPVRAVLRRTSSRKASFKHRKISKSPYELRRQSSLPITQTDHTSFSLSHQETMAIHNHSNERPTCSLSNRTEPTVQSQSPSNSVNVIDLQAALQAVSAVATGPVVTRIPLQNSIVTNNHISSNYMERGATPTSNSNQGNETIDSGNFGDENEDYLRQLHRYGVLLRMMGDKLDADYCDGCYEMKQPSNQVVNQKPRR